MGFVSESVLLKFILRNFMNPDITSNITPYKNIGLKIQRFLQKKILMPVEF